MYNINKLIMIILIITILLVLLKVVKIVSNVSYILLSIGNVFSIVIANHEKFDEDFEII